MAQQKLTRDEMRAQLLGNVPRGKSELVTLFGVEVEFRQPTLGAILNASKEVDETSRTLDMFINYAYVPGTNEKVFEDTDKEVILGWPFGEDLQEVQKAVLRLTGVDLAEAEEELQADPLEG